MDNWDTSDPFGTSRRSRGVLDVDFDGERIPMILRYGDVRNAATDHHRFSSDAPFRVPIPDESAMRAVRQLPIETDPPEHTQWRELVRGFFSAPKRADFIQSVEALCQNTVLALPAEFDAVRDFALPLQSRALALLLHLPPEHAETWIGWGLHVFRGDEPDKRGRFEAYLETQIERSGDGDDLFSALSRAEFDGRPLRREEILGFANLAFAGGRDTLIAVLVFAVAYLAEHPRSLDEIRARPALARSATEEFVRVVSPLTHIGRVCPVTTDVHGTRVDADERVSLCWASANRDDAVFDDAGEVVIDRQRNPHLGFGAGPHTCLGASHARLLLRSTLSALADHIESIRILEAEPRYESWPGYRRQVGFEALRVHISRREVEG